MAYILDADALIQAKDDYYGFDICPGFWDWLDREAAAGRVFSIDIVGKELLAGNDALAAWAKKHGAAFFRPLDTATQQEMPAVAAWVQAHDFREHAKRQFLAGADAFLVAYAKAHGHTVVTHEIANPDVKRQVKLPVVCGAFGVPSLRTFEFLRQCGARFVLDY